MFHVVAEESNVEDYASYLNILNMSFKCLRLFNTYTYFQEHSIGSNDHAFIQYGSDVYCEANIRIMILKVDFQ